LSCEFILPVFTYRYKKRLPLFLPAGKVPHRFNKHTEPAMTAKELAALAAAAGEQPPAFDFTKPAVPATLGK
jgi:hypothetical protein